MANEQHYHGPDNAEHELRKAYNEVIEASVGSVSDEAAGFYLKAFRSFRDGERLAAERWARATKHLARALRHEAKIDTLAKRSGELPYLGGATPDEYGPHAREDLTIDLLDSLSIDPPPGLPGPPPEMTRMLARGRRQLELLEEAGSSHELLRAERILAAHEYGRVVECMALAIEAESRKAA